MLWGPQKLDHGGLSVIRMFWWQISCFVSGVLCVFADTSQRKQVFYEGHATHQPPVMFIVSISVISPGVVHL